MKKILGITAVLSISILLYSCKKFLTEEPLTSVSLNQYFKSAADITASMAGVYSSFQQQMKSNYHYWGEVRSDNFDRSGYPNSTSTELSLNALTSGNDAADWTGLYTTIGRANTCIKYIPQVLNYDPTVSQTDIDNNLAQCYAMRAMCYFYIVRLWGDAPIWTEPYENLSQEPQKPRSPKATILDSVIIPDLTKAYSLIQKNQTANVWYINEGAICAIMADVYMWKHDAPNAIIWINNLFKAKGPTGKVYAGTSGANLETTANWKNLFMNPTASIEPVWSINWDYTTNGCMCLPVSKAANNNPVTTDSLIYADWKKNKADIRVTQTLDTLGGLNHQDKLKKYYRNDITDWTKPEIQQMNVYLTMYRLGDIYLLYAEALNQTGEMSNALKYLNYIRVRAGLAAYLPTDDAVSTGGVLDQTKLETAILQERQYELFGEGKRWFDLVRTDRVEQVMNPILVRRQRDFDPLTPQIGFGTDKNKYLWPISIDVLNSNALLTQNPSYN